MGKSFSVPLMYVDSGDGNTLKMDSGRTVSLREAPYTGDLYVLSETGANTGIYKHDNVEDKIVRLYVNGAWKQDYGTFRTYGDLTAMLEPFFKRDGSTAMTGEFNGGGFRMHHIGDPVSGIDVGDRDYNDSRYVLQSNYSNNQPAKVLYVSNLLAEVTGKTYATIQGAINYAHSSGPNNSNYWKIYVFPNSGSANGYSENLTFQPNIKLIGLGLVKVTGSVSGFSLTTSFENFMFQSSGNITFNNSVLLRNCIVRLTGSSSVSITLDTVRAVHLGIIASHPNHSISSNGGNNVTGWSNRETTWQTDDYAYMNYLPGLTDLDSASEPD